MGRTSICEETFRRVRHWYNFITRWQTMAQGRMHGRSEALQGLATYCVHFSSFLLSLPTHSLAHSPPEWEKLGWEEDIVRLYVCSWELQLESVVVICNWNLSIYFMNMNTQVSYLFFQLVWFMSNLWAIMTMEGNERERGKLSLGKYFISLVNT